MAKWGDQTCPLRVQPSNWYAITPHKTVQVPLIAGGVYPNQMTRSFLIPECWYFLVAKMQFFVNGHQRLNDGIDYMVDASFSHE